MIYLPEEINEKTEGNITTITHNNYKQLKFIDKDKKETFREKITFDEPQIYNTTTHVIETQKVTKVGHHYHDNGSDCFIF